MSRFLDSEPRLLSLRSSSSGVPRTAKVTSNTFLSETDRYAVMNEQGSARNLHKLNLTNSIYEDLGGEPDQIEYVMFLI